MCSDPPDVSRRIFHTAIAFSGMIHVGGLHHGGAAGLERWLIKGVAVFHLEIDRAGHRPERANGFAEHDDRIADPDLKVHD